MHRKTQGIIDAAVKLGAAESTDFSGGGVVKTLKELAVATGCAESVSDVDANSISGVLNFIAENGEDIVYPEPTGTKSITENGTVDVKDYASAEVAVPASAVVSGSLSIIENGTYDVTDKASAEVNVASVDIWLGTMAITNNTNVNITVYNSVILSEGVLRTVGKGITAGATEEIGVLLQKSSNRKTFPRGDLRVNVPGATAQSVLTATKATGDNALSTLSVLHDDNTNFYVHFQPNTTTQGDVTSTAFTLTISQENAA